MRERERGEVESPERNRAELLSDTVNPETGRDIQTFLLIIFVESKDKS